MVRRVELVAGIAAGIVGMLSLAILLFAPLVPYCPATTEQPCTAVRYDALVRLGMSFGLRMYLLGMLGLLLIGAGCAVAEARGGRRGTRMALWSTTVVALVGSTSAVQGLGLVFLPTVFVLCIANYASLMCRLGEWRSSRALRVARALAEPVQPLQADPSPDPLPT